MLLRVRLRIGILALEQVLEMPDTVILHLSDLHLASDADRRLLDDIEAAVRDRKPAVIVISGDFVNGPDAPEMTAARDRLRKLAKDLGGEAGPCAQVIVPGNHDYRESGIYSRSPSKVFDEVFGRRWRDPTFIASEKRKVAFFCFDSNTNDPRINFARGRVGRDEFRRFANDYTAMQEQRGTDFAEAYKIAVLHHHPMAIADSELAGSAAPGRLSKLKHYFTRDAFLGLEDAGVFMREMVTRDIDLVLHGHKHFAFFARVEVDTADEKTGETRILAAGSASKSDEDGGCKNSFNLITLREDGTVGAERWDNHSGGFYKRKDFPLVTYEQTRARAFANSCQESAFIVAREFHNTAINSYGDCDREILREEIVSSEARATQEIPVETSSVAAIYAGLTLHSMEPLEADPIFVPSADCKRGEIRGKVQFARPLGPEPISFQTSYRAYNAFAFTREQRLRMRDANLPEYQSVKIRYPIKSLSLSIRFQPEGAMPKPAVRVFAQTPQGADVRNFREERFCEQHLHTRDLLRVATLSVSMPLRECCYALEWILPSEKDEPENPRLSLEDEEMAQHIRQCLAVLRPEDANHPAQAPLRAAHEKIVAQYAPSDPQEHIELGLMVFDDRINRLRFVGGTVRPEFQDYQLRDGQGVGGRAHKLNQNILIARRRLKSEEDFTADPPSGVEPSEFLLCLPLSYPIARSGGLVVGVITLASDSRASKLLSLYSRTEVAAQDKEKQAKELKAQEALKRLIQMLSEECFFNIVSSLGLSIPALTRDEVNLSMTYTL